ncbi:hypothetical protein L1887_63478 [Cichorium endivia]|nr:hypothetical protein L1887_63478 [Cichorium endivia]
MSHFSFRRPNQARASPPPRISEAALTSACARARVCHATRAGGRRSSSGLRPLARARHAETSHAISRSCPGPFPSHRSKITTTLHRPGPRWRVARRRFSSEVSNDELRGPADLLAAAGRKGGEFAAAAATRGSDGM